MQTQPKNLKEWHRWFAWFPVDVGNTLTWLEYVERRCEFGVTFGDQFNFYRPVGGTLPAKNRWLPIATLHDTDRDTQTLLWNPCDGLHLLSFTATPGDLDEIRRGEIFTHYQRLSGPDEGRRA